MSNMILEDLVSRIPELEVCKKDIDSAFNVLKNCFANDNKLLVAGNGGSCADAEHLSGELMKGFRNNRIIDESFAQKLKELDGQDIVEKLQEGLPVIALHNHSALNTAFINDIDGGGQYLFAQQVYVYGNKDDVLLVLSTSGNSKNIYKAALVAKAKGMKIIALTGESGGLIKNIADITIKAPAKETFIIQEYHLPIYHCLCLMLEKHFFN